MEKLGIFPKIVLLCSMVVVATPLILAPATAVVDPVTYPEIAHPVAHATSTATDVALMVTWQRIAQAKKRNVTTAVSQVI